MLHFSLNKKLCHLFLNCVLIAVIWCIFICGSAHAARNQFDEYQVKAAFLYNLTNFTFWPDDCFASEESPFVITILGKNPFGKSLELLVKDERVNNHPIQIRQIKQLKELEITHILFIPSEFKKEFTPTLKHSSQSGLLTVSDYPDFCKLGGAVNLLIDKNRFNLEINPAAAKQHNLKFSSKLLQLARLVETVSQ